MCTCALMGFILYSQSSEIIVCKCLEGLLSV